VSYKKKIRGFILDDQVQHKQATVQREVDLEKKVNNIVGFNLLRGHYMIFAKEINKLMKKYKEGTLIAEIAIKEQKWATRGLDESILNQIENLFSDFIFKFDEGRFNLCRFG